MLPLDFKPHFFIRNKHLQTIISSKKRPEIGGMVAHEQLINIDVKTDEEVHLTGYYSPQIKEPAKGLVILLHGWLGCVRSTYMLARGEQLYQAGYEVFRLNMRDHGQTVALNSGVFHGARLEEVFLAVQYIAQQNLHLPVTLIGFSMGGSFALRIGWWQSINNQPIFNLKKIIAICPSVNPEHVTNAIDNSPIYRRYFCNKWRMNLQEKQQFFPHLYDFGSVVSLKTCRQMTEALIKLYSDYSDINAYFSEYHFSKEKLKLVSIPMTVLAAADDPVIPVEGFQELESINPHLELVITNYGGHVGYINSFSGDSWLDKILPSIV